MSMSAMQARLHHTVRLRLRDLDLHRFGFVVMKKPPIGAASALRADADWAGALSLSCNMCLKRSA